MFRVYIKAREERFLTKVLLLLFFLVVTQFVCFVCARAFGKARAAHASTTTRLCRKRTRNKQPSSLSTLFSRLCLIQNCDDSYSYDFDDDDTFDVVFFVVVEQQRRRCVVVFALLSSFFRSEERDDALVVLLLFRRCCREKRRGVVVLLPSSSSPFDKIAARGSAQETKKPKQQQRLWWGGKETRFVCFVVYVVICVR